MANCSRMRTKETEEMQRANEKKEEEEEKVAVRVFRTLVGKFLWKIEEIEEIEEKVVVRVFRTLVGKLPSDGGRVASALHTSPPPVLSEQHSTFIAATTRTSTKGTPHHSEKIEQEQFPIVNCESCWQH